MITGVPARSESRPKKIRVGWYKVSKNYRGGGKDWAVYISKSEAQDWENEVDLIRDIGEKTDGGSESGFSIKCRYFGQKKPKNCDDLEKKTYTTYFWKHIPGEATINRNKARERMMEKIYARQNQNSRT